MGDPNKRVLCTTLITTLLITGSLALASHTEETVKKCSTHCRSTHSDSVSGPKFKYNTGSSYIYSYNAVTSTFVNGTSNDKSQIAISASAEFYVESSCEFILQLRDVQLEDTSPDTGSLVVADRNAEFKSALERHPLRFQFNDGVIDDLCPDDDEIPFALNIKRGILSVFQNSMKRLHSHTVLYEKDVTGVCKTHYEIESIEWYKLLIKKTKNLLNCGNHVQESPMTLSLPTSSTPQPSQLKTQPLIKSTQECTQSITHSGLINTATCHETHLFKPFSNDKKGGSSGVVTDVKQTILFVSVTPSAVPPKADNVNIRTTLLFDHVRQDSENKMVTEESVYEVLDALEENSLNGVNNNFIPEFSKLVSHLKTLGYPQITKIFSKTDKVNIRKFLLDAMPLVSTADSMTVMRDLFKAKEISTEEMDYWLTSLAFQKKPTIEMISAMKPLLDDGFHAKAMLGISSLVHSYCQINKNCSNESEVLEVMKRIEEYIGDNCETDTRAYKEAVIVALKSIGNTGVFGNSMDKLEKCFDTKSNPVEVRLAAISALRRMPCDNPLRSSVLDVYTDIEEDTELRIAGYLTVMQCPSTEVIKQVIDTLYNDEVNQVASFVWTHLTNLQETSSVWKKDIKNLLQNEYLQNKFKTDVIKFSRNYEGSVFDNDLNAGATVESNLIFTPDSYLPRSAALNLTIDLFGETLNIFEVGTRLEGFEQIVERLFGENGYFKDDSALKILQNLMKYNSEESKSNKNTNNNNLMNNEIIEYAKDFKANNKLQRKPQGAFYGRVFGNELYLNQFEGLNELFDTSNKMNDYQSSNTFFDFTRSIFNNKSVDYTKSMNFLNTNYVIPTIIGLPLQLSVNGSATVGLKFNGESDFKDLFKSLSASMAVTVNPSAAVEVIGIMSVDAFVTQSGLKSINKLNTNTKNEFNFNMKNGEIVELSFGLPKNKMEIIELSSELFVVQKNKSILIKPSDNVSVEKWDTCSGDRVITKTGLQLCSKLLYNNASLLTNTPYFPLTGPFHYALSLEKTDSFTEYYFKFQKYNFYKDRNLRSMSLLFDTPGSKMNRKFEVSGSLDLLDDVLELSLDTPVVGNYKLRVDYDNYDNKKGLTFLILHDSNQIINVALGLLISSSNRSGWYKPSLIIDYNNKRYIEIIGNVNYDHGSKYSSNLVISELTEKPFVLAGDLNLNKDKYNADIKMVSPVIEVKAKGVLKYSKTSVSAKSKMQYYFVSSKSKMHTVDFNTKLQRHKKGNLSKEKAHLSLQMSAWPQYNLAAAVEVQHGRNYFNSESNINFGETEWFSKQMYSNIYSKNGQRDFAIKLNLACPDKNLDYKAEIQHKVNETDVLSYALAQLNSKKRFVATFNHKMISELEQEVNIEISDPWKGVSANGIINMTECETTTGSVSLTYGPHNDKKTYAVNAEHTITETEDSLKHEIYSAFFESDKTTKKVNFNKPFGSTNASFYTEYGENENKTNLYTSVDYRNDIYLIDFNHTKDAFSHLASFKLLRPGTDLSAVLDVKNLVNYKKLSLDIMSQRNISFTIWTHNNADVVERRNIFDQEGEDNDMLVYDMTAGLSFYWDKDNDDNKAIILSVKSNDRSKVGELTLPGQYYHLNADYSNVEFETHVSWGKDKITAKKQISLESKWLIDTYSLDTYISLTTSFKNFENQKLVFNLINSYSKGVLLTSRVEWQKSVTILDYKGHIFDKGLTALLNIKSTIPAINEITLDLTLDGKQDNKKSERRHSAAFKFSFNNLETSFVGDFIKQKSDYKSDFKFFSAYLDDTRNKISGKFNFNKTLLTFNTTWGNNQSILLLSNFESPRNYYLQIDTPLPIIRNVLFNVNLINSSNHNYQMESNIRFNDHLSQISLRNIYVDKNLTLLLNLTSTYQDIKLLFIHEYIDGDDNIHSTNNKLLFFANNIKYLSSETNGNISSNYLNKVNLNSVLNLLTHEFVLDLSHNFSDYKNLNSSLVINYNKIYGIDVKMNYEDDVIKRNINTYLIAYNNTMGNNTNNIIYAFKHEQLKNKNYNTLLILPFNYIIKHDFNFYDGSDDNKIWDNFIEVINSGGTFTKVNKIYNTHKFLKDEKNNVFNVKHDMNIVTNDVYVSTVKLNFTYNYLTNFLSDASLSFMLPLIKPVYINYNLKDDGKFTQEMNFIMDYNDDQQLKFTSSLIHFPASKNLSFRIATPYSKDIAVNSNINFMDNGIKKINMFLMYDYNTELYTEVQFKENLLNPLLHINIEKSNNLNVFNLNTSYNLLNSFNKFGYFKIDTFDYKILLNSSFVNNKEKIDISTSFVSNLKEFENIYGNIEIFKNVPSQIKLNSVYRRNNDHVRFVLSTLYNKLEKNVDAHIITRLGGKENSYKLQCFSLINLTKSKSILNLLFSENGHSIKFDSTIDFEHLYKKTALFTIETPYEGYKLLSAEANYIVHDDSHKFVAKLHNSDETPVLKLTVSSYLTNDKKIHFQLLSKKDYLNDITGVFEIKVNENDHQETNLILRKDSKEIMMANLILSYDNESFNYISIKGHIVDEYNINIRMKRLNKILTHFAIDFGNEDNIKFLFSFVPNNHSGPPIKFDFKFDDYKITFHSIGNIEKDAVHHGSVELPENNYLKIKNITFYGKYNIRDLSNWKGHLTFSFDDFKTNFNGSSKNNYNENTELQLTSSLNNFSGFNLTTNLFNKFEDNSTTFVILRVNDYNFDLNYYKNQLKAYIKSPIKSYEEIELFCNFNDFYNFNNTKTKHFTFHIKHLQSTLVNISSVLYTNTNWNEHINIDAVFFIDNTKNIKLSSNVLHGADSKEIYVKYIDDMDFFKLNFTSQPIFTYVSTLIEYNFTSNSNKLEMLLDLTNSKKVYYLAMKTNNDFSLFEIKGEYELNSVKNLVLTSSLNIYSEMIFFVNILCDNLLKMKSDLILPMTLEYRPKLYAFDLHYDFVESKKDGLLRIRYGNEKHQIVGKYLLSDKEKDTFGLFDLYIYSGSDEKSNTLSLQSSFNFGTNDSSSKDFNVRVNIDDDNYFIIKSVMKTSKESYFQILLPPLLRTTWLEGVTGRYDFSNDKKVGSIRTFGEMPFKFDAEFNKLNYAQGEVTLNMFIGPNEIHHYVNVTYDLKNEIEVSLELIYHNENLMNFKLVFDGLLEGLISLDHQFGESKFNILFNYDFLDITKTINFKSDVNLNYYEFRSSFLIVNSVLVLNINSTIPDNTIKVLGGFKATEEHFVVFLKTDHNDLKKVDIIFSRELNDNNSDVKLNFYIPYLDIQIQSLVEDFNIVDVFVNTTYNKDDNLNITNEFTTSIKCSDWTKCASNFQLAGSHIDTLSFESVFAATDSIRLNVTGECKDKKYNLYGEYSNKWIRSNQYSDFYLITLKNVVTNVSVVDLKGNVVKSDSGNFLGNFIIKLPDRTNDPHFYELSIESSKKCEFENVKSNDVKSNLCSSSDNNVGVINGHLLSRNEKNIVHFNQTLKIGYVYNKNEISADINIPRLSIVNLNVIVKSNSSYASFDVINDSEKMFTSYASWNNKSTSLEFDSLIEVKKLNNHNILNHFVGKTALNFKFNNKHLSSFIFESPFKYCNAIYYRYNIIKNIRRGSITHEIDFTYNHYFTHSDNYFRLLIEENASKNYAVDFILMTPGSVSRFFNYNYSVMMDVTFNSSNYLLDSDIKLYPSDKKYYSVKITNKVNNTINNINTHLEIIEARTELNWLNEMSVKELLSVKSNLPFYDNSTKYFSNKNVTSNIEVNFHSKKFLEIDSGFKKFPLINTDVNNEDSISSFYVILLYPGFDYSLCNYKISTTLKSRNNKYTNGNLLLTSLSSIYNLTYVLDDNSFDSNIQLISPEFEHDIEFGYENQINSNESDINKLIFYFNQNKIITSYKLNDQLYINLKKIEININENYVTINGNINIETNISPHFEQIIKYTINDNVGTVRFITRKERNDIKSVLNIESNEMAFALTVKANMVDLNPFVEVRCSYGDGESDGYDQTYSAYITYENDDLEINKLIGQIKSPYFGDYFTKITLNKKSYNYFEINLNDYLLLDLRKDSNSGQLYLKFGPSEHHIKYDVIKNTRKNDFYKIVLDADVLSWQINGNVNKENNNINIVTEIGKSEALEKSNFILQLNESNLVLETNIYLAVDTEQDSEETILMATRLNDKYSFVVNLFNDESNVHGKIAYDKNYFENILMFSHNKVHPVNSELNFTNPDGTLKALINMNNTNMYSYIGQIDSIDDQFLEFNGGIIKNNKERQILLELKFPTSFSLKKIYFNIMADQHDSEIKKYNFDLYYLSDFNNDKSISENGVKSMLIINNIYNVEAIFHLTTPFDTVKELDFHIVSIHNEVMNNIYGKFITRLPNYKKYIFTADLLKNTTTVSKLYILSSVLQSYHSSNYSLIDDKQNKVVYSFKGTYKSNIINNDKFLYNLLVNWNDKDIAEVGLENLINMKNNYVNLNWFVKTFLPSIEKYELELILENEHRKQIILHLNTPFSLDGHDFDIELLYEYNNITDNNMKMFINIPFVNELQKIGFNIENRINIDRNYIFSNLRIIHKNDLTFGYKISLAIVGKKINADLLVESNENVFGFKLFNERNENFENVLVHIVTPLKSFTGAKLDALFNKDVYSGSKLIVEFNNVEYFATNFSRNNDINIAEVKTFNRLLIFNHYYNFKNGYEIYGKVGWSNLDEEALVSTVETSVKLFGITKKNYFFISTVLPDFDRSTSLELLSSNNRNEFEYFGKLSLSEDKNFGFKYNKTLNNEYETKLILPSKIIKVNYGKNIVLSPNNVKSYYSLNWGKLENTMKKLSVEFNDESLNDNLNTVRRKIIFNHFSLNDGDIEILLITNKNKINLEIMHSKDEADKFKTEFERWVSNGSNGLSPKDENVISQGINILISHPKSYLYYQLSTNRTLSTKKDNLEVLLKYINEYNVYKSLNIFGNIDLENNDMSLNIGTNKNRLNFGVSSWSKDNNYKGFSFKTAINNKEPLKLETNLNNNAAIEMELDYGNSRSYHLYAGMPNDRLLKAEISHSMYGSQNSDFVTKLQLNTTRLLWGYIEYSPEIYEDFYNNIVTEYEDYGLVLDEIYNCIYSSIEDDKFYNKLQNLIHDTVLKYFEIILEDTFIELEHVFMYINELNDLFNDMFNNNHYYIKDIYNFFTAGITYTSDKLLLIARCCMDFMEGILEPFKIVFRIVYTAVEIETEKVKLSTDNIKAMFKTGIENSKELFSSINTTKLHMKEVVINLLQTTRHELNVLEKTIFLEYYKASLYASQLYNEMIYNLNLKIAELNKLINQLRMFVDSVEESVFDIVKSIEESLLSVTELRTAVEYYSEYSNWLQTITLHDFVDDFKQFVEQVIELVVEDVHKNFGELKTYLNIASDIVIGNYDTISNTPIGNYISEIFSKIYYKTKWLWHYSEMQERLQSNLRQLLIDIDKILERFINNLERTATNDDKELETSISVSPDYTSVQFTQELPIDWESFNRIPNFEQLPEYNNVLETANNTADLDKYRYYLYDAISYYTGSDISLASIIPEFGSTAVIAGNHYITFDKVFYDFDGGMIGSRVNCDSLILASDFLNNKFTIIINYLTQNCETKKDSLTILIDNHEINFNFISKLITVNGKRMEMPLQIGEALIYRDINNIIIDNKDHFLINCNTNYDVCSFKLNGWYFGKTGGLLGTYNNEPVDDFSFANGTTTQYLDRFISSWVLHSEVNRCAKIENDPIANIQSNTTQLLTTDFVNDDYNICGNYFESRNSIFSKCFAHIQPAPYFHMCSNDMKEISTDTDKFIVLCMISEVYVAQCNSVGIKLNMPPICSRCDSSNNEMLFAGSTFYYNDDTPPPKSTDVVFIVEEDPCVQNVKLSDVISKLDIALSSSGIKNNQYAVIGFNSGSPTTSLLSDKPFIRTVDSDIWSNDIKRFEKAFKRSVYQPSNNIIPTSNDNANDNTLEMPPAYKALKLASTLKFRPGVSKTFILIQCDKCSKNYIETSYSELMQTMLDLDVTLHILQNKAIDGINGKSSKVFGVDINGAFTGRNVKTLVPSAPLLKQVSIPKDICTPMALETNGTLFNLDKIGKKFMDVWIRRVTHTASPSSCQECNCVQMTDGSSNTLCHECDTQSTQDVLSEWGSVTNDLDNEEPDYDVNQDIEEMEDTIDYDTSKRLLSSLLSIQSAMNNMEKNI